MEKNEIKKGLKVWYFPVILSNGDKLNGRVVTIRDEFICKVGGEDCCFLDGVSGCVSIKHLSKIDEEVEHD